MIWCIRKISNRGTFMASADKAAGVFAYSWFPNPFPWKGLKYPLKMG